MTLDEKIERAFERHETDVRPGPSAWQEVQQRVRRRHRARLAATALGAAVAVAGAFVVVPKIGSEPTDRFDALPDGWQSVRSDQGGFRVGFPPGWKVSDDLGLTLGVPPDSFSASDGKPLLTVTLSMVPEAYDKIPGSYRYAPDKGRLRGRAFNRYSEASFELPFSRRITYRIEWPRLCPRAPCRGSYTLVATIAGTDERLWDRYLPVGERIVKTAEPSPVSFAPEVPGVEAKIAARAIALAASSDSLWAVVPSRDGTARGTLVKIDPRTDRIVARIDVGVTPAGVAVTADAVWVTHGGCQGSDQCASAARGDPLLANSVWRIDARTNRVVARIDVEDAGDIAFGEGAVWVAGSGIHKIDPITNRVVGDVSYGGRGPAQIAVGGGVLWAVAFGGPDPPSTQPTTAVNRIDVDNLRVIDVVKIPAGIHGADVALGYDGVWVTSTSGDSPTALARFDPGSSAVTRTISLPEAGNTGLHRVTTGGGYVWTVTGRGQLWKVDPTTNRFVGSKNENAPPRFPLTIGDVPPIGASDIVVAFGSVWVASDDGQIWRLAP